jgi:hypothetical protein
MILGCVDADVSVDPIQRQYTDTDPPLAWSLSSAPDMSAGFGGRACH